MIYILESTVLMSPAMYISIPYIVCPQVYKSQCSLSHSICYRNGLGTCREKSGKSLKTELIWMDCRVELDWIACTMRERSARALWNFLALLQTINHMINALIQMNNVYLIRCCDVTFDKMCETVQPHMERGCFAGKHFAFSNKLKCT